MKVLIVILIIASFLQASILPLDLAALILVIRAYITRDKSNLYLAFFLGLLVSHLTVSPWGLQSLIYIFLVQIASFLGKLSVASNVLTVVLLALFSICFNTIAVQLLSGSSLSLSIKILVETILALPMYVFIRFWEERFIVRPDVRLKM